MSAIHGLDDEAPRPRGCRIGSAAFGPTPAQWLTAGLVLLAVLAGLSVEPAVTKGAVHVLIVAGCGLSACAKLALAIIARAPPAVEPLRRDRLPRYTILAPIYREAAVAAQLVAALTAIDYPRDRLQAILILEQDDEETLGALAWLRLPPFIEVLVRPPGGPRTKPNALNAALPLMRGELLVIYDAEDIPAPYQLREAAARFHAEPDLVCLQAPLRIGNPGAGFLARQFALEYAGLFEAILPGLARLGSPFPLGGTSNHLRSHVLRAVGGWDAFNVTEDADLGFRIAGQGRVGVMAAATREDAPTALDNWLPQRARWVKGYMQTWGVHMRRPFAGGWRKLLALQATLGIAIMGAALHGPLILMLVAALVIDILQKSAAPSVIADIGILVGGWAAAALTNAVGARRAAQRMRVVDALGCLGYWPLQSLAFWLAVRQLILAPHRWDKTTHVPSLDAGDANRAAPLDAPSPWSVSPAA